MTTTKSTHHSQQHAKLPSWPSLAIAMEQFSELQVHFVAVGWRDAMSRSQQKRFYRELRRFLKFFNLYVHGQYGLCAVLPLDHALSETDVNLVLHWLVDQQEVSTVITHNPRSAMALMIEDFSVHNEDDTTLSEIDQDHMRGWVRHVLLGAMRQRAHARDLAHERTLSQILGEGARE